MKKLLLTTDDFGMCHAVNQGIVQAMTLGIARSTNFLAPAPWFAEAVSLAKEHKLEVGVHLCLTADWDRLQWGPLTANPRLRNEAGRFPAMHAALEGQGATDDDFYDELKAQILLVKKTYGEPTHVETHMIGGVAGSGGPVGDRVRKVIKTLCAEFKLTYTYERDEAGQLKHFIDEDCMSLWSPDEIFAKLATWQAPGRYHLFGHAAVDSDELDAICSKDYGPRVWAREARVRDLAFYIEPLHRAKIEALGFELLSSVSKLGPI